MNLSSTVNIQVLKTELLNETIKFFKKVFVDSSFYFSTFRNSNLI